METRFKSRYTKEQWSEFILDLRRRAGITQKQLAKKLGADRKTLNTWERGRRMLRPQAEQKLLRLAALSDERLREIFLNPRYWDKKKPRKPRRPASSTEPLELGPNPDPWKESA